MTSSLRQKREARSRNGNILRGLLPSHRKEAKEKWDELNHSLLTITPPFSICASPHFTMSVPIFGWEPFPFPLPFPFVPVMLFAVEADVMLLFLSKVEKLWMHEQMFCGLDAENPVYIELLLWNWWLWDFIWAPSFSSHLTHNNIFAFSPHFFETGPGSIRDVPILQSWLMKMRRNTCNVSTYIRSWRNW